MMGMFALMKWMVRNMDPIIANYGLNEKKVLLYRYIRTIERMTYPQTPPLQDPTSEWEIDEYVRGTPLGFCPECQRIVTADLRSCEYDGQPLYIMSGREIEDMIEKWEDLRTKMRVAMRLPHVTRRIVINIVRLQEVPIER